ncbi:hypothetical protein ACH0BF_02255 [Pseudobacillus sp. 179-B 2D1 NHS]
MKLEDKYTVILKTEPSKIITSEKDIEERIKKAVKLLVNELILNGHLKV